jgi:hypothetical protein
VILSIRLAIRGFATLMQFRGVSHKLALTAKNNRKQFPIKETAQTTG